MRTGKTFFEFVDPQDRRRDRFGRLDHRAHVLFGRTNKTAEDLADIEAQQRHLPQRANRFGGQRFTGTGHADHQDALGQRQTEIASAR